MNKDNWRSPPELVDDALALLGIDYFDCDVCCTSSETGIEKTQSWITVSDNAFNQNWFYEYDAITMSNVVFCNPPFSEKWQFLERAINQVNTYKKSVLMVLPYAPVTKDWRDNIDQINCFVFVPDGRYQFLTEDGKLPMRLNKKTGKMEKSSPDFPVALILIVPFYTNGAKYINFKRGIGNGL